MYSTELPLISIKIGYDYINAFQFINMVKDNQIFNIKYKLHGVID